jgi:uncharacterized protein with NAD-binding domain and iron-sulfur cluster
MAWSNMPTTEPLARSAQVAEVAVFGAGIAGMSAAHELARLGHRVRVFEALPEAGGFFRSARNPDHDNMPSEYSWHGMGPWYHNTFDIMRQIPYDGTGSIYERCLSRPIDFGIFPDQRRAEFYDKPWRSIPAMFSMEFPDFVRWFHLMAKTWTSDLRSRKLYSQQSAAARWDRLLNPRAGQAWRACFGPWIGSDWTLVSLHTAGEFFRKQLMTRPQHLHPADEEGPGWKQGAGDGWLLLKGPSSEAWFHPWVSYLKELGVQFFWNEKLETVEPGRASLESGQVVEADHFIVAINPFSARQVFMNHPELSQDPELAKFGPLTRHGPHSQVSFRLAFSQPIRFPRPRTAVVLADSEFNITLFAQEQAWHPEVELGQQVRSLWTGTACIATRPGRIYGKTLNQCTRQEFEREIIEQVWNCQALNDLIAEANHGKTLQDFPLLRLEIWHEWEFNPLRPIQPKWVNTFQNQEYLPDQRTGFPQIHLAGAHTRTEADVWSIEAAVESGRRAARLVDPRAPVLSQYRPLWLKVLGWLDNLCYQAELPHILDLVLSGAALLLLAACLNAYCNGTLISLPPKL